jgi:hypothetical protein
MLAYQGCHLANHGNLCWQGGGYAGEERLAQGWGDTGKALRAQEWLCEQVLRIGDR